tara:strand:+ start:240 stop:344 length:105 start_codon:yes stop_codon:yes gene_type:complete
MFLLKLLGILLYGKDYELIEQASQEKARKKIRRK